MSLSSTAPTLEAPSPVAPRAWAWPRLPIVPLWCAFAVVWSLLLLTTGPSEVTDVVLPKQAVFPVTKLGHLAAYALFAALTWCLPVARRWRFLPWLFLSLHAAGTEYLQQFVPNRHASVTDVFINHGGILLGWLAMLLWQRTRRSS